jgi:hypothetical protein
VSAPVSEDDRASAQFVIGIELAARDLYRAAIEAGATGTAWAILADQHSSYGQSVAGLTGISANTVDSTVFDAHVAAFQSDRPANAAYELENTLIATHAALLGQIAGADIAEVLASIVAMESHHAAYLAERSGRGENFDALFTNSATPLAPAVGQ